MVTTRPALLVFAGARNGRDPALGQAARALGQLLATRGVHLIYGGARCGLMGQVADAALSAGGQVTGVITSPLSRIEGVQHNGLSRLEIVPDIQERKARMTQLADAAVVLPGGLGTLDETYTLLAGAQLGEHTKPVGLLDTNGYWQPTLTALAAIREHGFIDDRDSSLVLHSADPTVLLDMVLGPQAQHTQQGPKSQENVSLLIPGPRQQVGETA